MFEGTQVNSFWLYQRVMSPRKVNIVSFWLTITDLVDDEVCPHVWPCAPVVEADDLLVVVHPQTVQDRLGELVRPGAVDHREEVADQTLAPVVGSQFICQLISKMSCFRLKCRVQYCTNKFGLTTSGSYFCRW